MAQYRIVCVTTVHPHRHIIDVGTGGVPSVATRRWTVEEARRAIAAGDMFYTQSPSTGRLARVAIDDCQMPGCTVRTIRSSPDAIHDNNLDDLPPCV